MWVGVGASDTEKHGAQQLCTILGVAASEIQEGGENGTSRTFPHVSVHLGQTPRVRR